VNRPNLLVKTTCTGAVLAAAIVAASAVLQADWPQFRGPDGNGHASSRALPLTWGEDKNVAWKTPIHGRGWSSPVVLGNQVWVTTATPDGRQLSALAVDTRTGKILHDLKLFDVATPQFAHAFNSYASPTPIIEPGRVYVTFGSPGTAAIDTATGKVVWKRRDLECNHFRGAGSSPIIFRNLLIMNFDGSDQQYVIALDKKTGKTVWKTARSIDFQDLGPDGKPQADGDFRKGYSTPQVTTVGGRPIMISLGSKAAYAYEPLTGKELWRVEERTNHSASTRPVVGHGMIFAPSGFANGHLLAIRPDSLGHATDASVVWRLTRGVPSKPSVTLVNDLIFMVNDRGITSAVDAKSGEVVWTSRVAGEYSASPVTAAGRIYLFSEDGKTTVLDAGRAFKILAESQLGDGFMASPAIDGDAFILRSRTHLYRIEEPRASTR
jgi:outer membrane protein assembly factor BamB